MVEEITMGTLEEFKQLTDTEQYFEFFEIPFDQRLIHAKRFHIMRKFGEMIANIPDEASMSEEKILEFYSFALMTVYKNFENGYNPSAAEVWKMFEKQGGCLSCQTSSSCDMQVPSAGCQDESAEANSGFDAGAGFNPNA